MAGIYKYFSSIKTNQKFRPSSKFAGGSVREDMKNIIELGRHGIHEAILGADVILAKHIDAILPFKPVYKAKLRNNWGHKLLKRGGEVYSKTSYGVFIDEGAKPHVPPYKPIAEWVASKTGAPRAFVKAAEKIALSPKGRTSKKKRKARSYSFVKFKKNLKGNKKTKAIKAFASIVLGLRLKIKSRGIAARNFVQSAQNELADDVLAKVLKNIDMSQASTGQLPLSMSLKQRTTSSESNINGNFTSSSDTVTT